MFFEATYVPSPPLSVASIDDNDIPSINAELPTMNDNSGKQSIESDIESDSDKPVDHVIFVIHGIGQQTEQYGHFYEHIENLQETTRQVLQAKIPDHNVRIELIPIEWHRHIHDQVDPLLNKITLKSIPTIRLIENDYLADVLFYFSKERGQTIVDNVTQLFNTSYHNFISKHPDFKGKIIILGYSLGGIITWDILSHQRELQTREEKEAYNSMNTIQFSKLDFKPHYFYGLGSPIGAVLVFRGQDPKYYHPEYDIQFENIFHPFDPLGYRFEPLFNDYFIDKPAVLIERSFPIGPSFSFPSFPSTGFFSFFSGKQQENKAAKTIYNATSETADNQKEQKTSSSLGFMTSLFQYFSKGGGIVDSTSSKEQESIVGSVNAVAAAAAADDDDDNDDKSIIAAAAAAAAVATTCWDPIQTREQLLALRDDLDRTLKNLSMNEKRKRRPKTIRSKTIHALEDDYYSSSIYSSSLEQNSDGSVMMDKFISKNWQENDQQQQQQQQQQPATRLKLRKTKTTEPRMARHHLVEILGIDGVSVDERSRIITTTLNKDNKEPFLKPNNQKYDYSFEGKKKKEEDESMKVEDHLINEKSTTHPNNNNIWLDLDNELNKPGPAITNPGESKADVAQDATVVAHTNTKAQEKDKQTDIEEEMEVNKLLPGKRRMDYVLQPESVMSMIANEYLIGLRAHFSYWTNKDFIWHMLRRIEVLEGMKKKQQQQQQHDDESSTTTSN
ncbi:uncharacterized protein BX663DRAFT_487054 [Cokeromyces recurvatus]|uniref:uncharacterized protein n=1 Tax=Cokeromyces recurvatus TaxID=90255 RepID=UPI00221F8380|nr:uncharacterized protein BX663DRAFT_487054 [Cokeromyces recurvatus]KAI7902267.1 hypothetical protein BX663DRAFT_487054 [Cokeromyces recurvatus]